MSIRRRLLLLLLAVGLSIAALAWITFSPSTPSTQDRARNTALSYVQKYMEWLSGPQVQSVHVVPVRSLASALASSVPRRVAQDVNVTDLQHRYGANRTVALVVLNGVYNTLPPDEGLDIHGDVVVLINPRPQKVLLLTW